jgi:2-polyprenyl-3-methyl-5-hydroxy-6-metoxy-1,4-benzoquinol methylase
MRDNLEEYDDPYVYEAEYGQYKGDFDLFLNLIDKGSVLDLGCGTGRLAIPLAHKELKVVGLDASEPMLELARHKSDDLSIDWMQGNICDFQLQQKFDLIIMAGNAFQALLSESDQIRMLNCVKQHLKPSGIFVFNTRNPKEHDFETTPEFELWHKFQDTEGEEVQVYGKQQSDLSHRIVTYTTKRVWRDKETITTIKLCFTPYDQLVKLFAQAGFEICDVYGDDKKTYFQKKSPSIVPLCILKLE